ncbi:MAG: NUDIX domain-containing protein [Planctomycetales bacterium]|nr:NUDIX domain-containing protein [Planctomycetales bacterium]
MNDSSRKWDEPLRILRAKLAHGENTSQQELDAIVAEWKPRKKTLREHDSDEPLGLVDESGRALDLTAERWLCHLLGLRHRCVQVVLTWNNPKLGRVLLLQVRSWSKLDSPGHLDVSVGGHVSRTSAVDSLATAHREMFEELGLKPDDLDNNCLDLVDSYGNVDSCDNERFHNAEWRDLYVGEVTTNGFLNCRLIDGEVAGLYLCPTYELRNFVEQTSIPMTKSLGLFLSHVYPNQIGPHSRTTKTTSA